MQKLIKDQTELQEEAVTKVSLDASLFLFKEALLKYMWIIKKVTDPKKLHDAQLDIMNLIKTHTGKEPKDILK